MACGSCGGGSKVTNSYQVMIAGKVAFTGQTIAESRIWIAQNANGARATIKAVPKK